jgi:hypothetical protein
MKCDASFGQIVKQLGTKMGLTFLVLGMALPASAQTLNTASPEFLPVGSEEYLVINSMPITINRNDAGAPMQQTTVSADGRYRFVSFLNALTQEKRPDTNPPTMSQLYRLASVYDRQTGQTIRAALPIRFEPQILPIRSEP